MKNLAEELKTIDHNIHHLNRYVRYITHHKNNPTKEEYTELHHICPSSMFPDYKNLNEHEWNGVYLSRRQHILAHIMLHRTFNTIQTASALMYMLSIDYHNTNNILINSLDRIYSIEQYRIRLMDIDEESGLSYAQLRANKGSEKMRNTIINGTSLLKVKAYKAAQTKHSMNDGSYYNEIGRKISEHHNTIDEETGLSMAKLAGQKTSETRKTLGLSKGEKNPCYGKYKNNHPKFGKTHSEEAKKKQSDALKGKKKTRSPCPYCSKMVDSGNMNRWHGDNCKSKPVQ